MREMTGGSYKSIKNAFGTVAEKEKLVFSGSGAGLAAAKQSRFANTLHTFCTSHITCMQTKLTKQTKAALS